MKLGFFLLKNFVFEVWFEIFYCNNKYNTYDTNFFPLKERKKLKDIWFLFKAVTIHIGKKTWLNCKNNYKDYKLAYFWLVDKLIKSILYYK